MSSVQKYLLGLAAELYHNLGDYGDPTSPVFSVKITFLSDDAEEIFNRHLADLEK